MINEPLDEKHAITIYRPIQYTHSLKAENNVLTLLDIKIKTGRYHQIRRHLNDIASSPIVGDKAYDCVNSENSKALRGHGIFLCCTNVTFAHPFYNLLDDERHKKDVVLKYQENRKFKDTSLFLDENGVVRGNCCIDLPEKFYKFLEHEEARYDKFNN